MIIGFIGLGKMGTPIALNLLEGGVDLRVYNRSKPKLEPLILKGAKAVNQPKDLFNETNLVFSMLANDEALIDVTLGDGGLLETIQPGGIHVSLSTVSPETIKKLAERHHEKKATLLTATVFGRPDAAEKKQLWVCLAGESQAKQIAEPYLKMIGQKIYDFGVHPETANMVKISGNFLILSVIEMLSEAFSVVKENGGRPEEFLALMTETIFPSPVFKNYGKIINQEEFIPAGFQMKLGLKDLSLFLGLAEKSGLDLSFAKALRERLEKGIKNGLEDLDWSAISLFSQKP
ncbi:NAD(P)-dependent oxidoreductase [Criblamydia sequanensis]|uniref:NAD-dependent oxidoreductase n=1 Tax=Candidatus Criblamydia sequanensis CRIB-18 TaxID=1437425 RepID=A0A090E449_9BACT|nr:NAD(P)-dependent oxidoreductase [Criblamydia sequanensis]CDR35249.1 NAD-dependent oxidoreductase [Criblamydia sequanensis CRIB-18]